jgi:transposase
MDFDAELDRFNPDPKLREWLRETLRQQQESTAALQNALVQKDTRIRYVEARNQSLILELAHLRRIKFGRKSESLAPDQRALFEEACDADLAAVEAEIEDLAQGKHKRRRHPGREALPDDLPRVEHRHEPESCTCGCCGNNLVLIREDISEQLDIEPSRFFVHRHIRPQYACRTCETITAAPVPPAVIEGGLAATGLLTWVVISKYLDHLPLYRLVKIAERSNVKLAIATLADWVGRTGHALQPLVDRMRELQRLRATLHADETPVQQLDPGKGKTKRAYLWAYCTNDLDDGPPIVVFDYQPGRSGQYAQAYLDGWQGNLVVDDYGGYKQLFGRGLTEIGCMAHARRKYWDYYDKTKSSLAAEALIRIGQLYVIEEQGKHMDVESRKQLREREAIPRLAVLKQWLQTSRKTVADGSGMARAIDYSLKRWDALCRYATTGNLPIDNNAIERAIRHIATGKKNWMFAGSERAGKRAAAIQSLLATAKLNGIDPAAWLKGTLDKLPTWPNNRLDELLPIQTQQ